MANVDIILSGFTPSEREYSSYGDNEPVYVYTFNGFDASGNSLDLSNDKGTYSIQGNENGPVLLGYSKASIGNQTIDVSDFNNYGDNNSSGGGSVFNNYGDNNSGGGGLRAAAIPSTSPTGLTSYYGMLKCSLNDSNYLLKIVELNGSSDYIELYLVGNDSMYTGYIYLDGTIQIGAKSSEPSAITNWVIIFGDNVFTDGVSAYNYFRKFSNGSSPQYG